MKRLHLTVEGQTEQAFAVDVLQPHLVKFGVMVVKPRLTGLHARRKGRIPTGGLLGTFAHSLEDIRRWLLQDKSADAFFSMMVDLYSLPKDFPGYDDAKKLTDPHEQAKHLEKALAREIADSRFIPYLQVHEFEAIILADPNSISKWLDNTERQVAELKAELETFETPEHVNDGLHTHPKARIKRHVVDYDENVDGPAIANYIGLDLIRAKCPHFSEWLTGLEQLDSRGT